MALCRACGFQKESAHLVAFASQFVDDAKINLIFFEKPNFNLEHDTVDSKPAFFNMATCHSYFWVKTYNYEAMTNNTIAFHFVPGIQGENFTKKLRCKENSPIILKILDDVLQESNLIKLGIALHAYADTFSHQGFSGMISKVNDIKNCEAYNIKHLRLTDKLLYLLKKINNRISENLYEKIFDRIIPAYGHGQAMSFPDYPYMNWSYAYDYSDEFNGSYKNVQINNKERFTKAFVNIKEYLEKYLTANNMYLDNEVNFDDYDILIDTLLFEGKDEEREERWKKVLVVQKLLSIEDTKLYTYQDDKWLKEAFANYDSKLFNDRKVEQVCLSDYFLDSNWYHFYLAVKWYKERFFKYCSDYQLIIPR